METSAARKKSSLQPQILADSVARIASDAKAQDIAILDVRNISSIADFFVILTGTSQNHLRAIARRIEDELREEGVKPASVDGARTTGWVAIDYGAVIVHAMTQDSRQLYDLERLWGDAPKREWA